MVKQASLLEVCDNLLADCEAIFTCILAAVLIERAVVVEDVYRLQLMRDAELVVVDVVGRGDLETARTEL